MLAERLPDGDEIDDRPAETAERLREQGQQPEFGEGPPVLVRTSMSIRFARWAGVVQILLPLMM
jgi:hypothetical protein